MLNLSTEHKLGLWSVQIENLLTNYELLAQYYLAGVDDPEREKMLQKIQQEAVSIWDDIEEELRIIQEVGFPYSQIRSARNQREVVSLNLLQDYHEGLCERAAYEQMLRRVFDVLLTSTNYSDAEINLYKTILTNSEFGNNEKCLAVTALSLNLWRKWDKSKCMLLLESLKNEDEAGMRALCGICLSILLHPNKYTAEDLYVMLMEHPTLNRRIDIFIRLIIRTAGTQKLSERLRTEFLPDLMKAGQKMQDKLDELPKDEEHNPNWKDVGYDSEIEAKIRAFGELQMSGADVYFVNFAELKRLNFFQQPYAWFLPFDKQHSSISDLFNKGAKSVLDVFIENGTLCNSDKYSFCLSIKQMPEEQRQIIHGQLGQEMEEQLEEGIQKLSKEDRWMRTANQYIQDLYRFFELFPAFSKEHKNPFRLALTWSQTPLFTNGILSMNQQIALADKLFSEEHYKEAIEIYEHWADEIGDAGIYQRMGYAIEKTSKDVKEALAFYRKADLIQPNDKWTLKRMAGIEYASGNHETALHLYEEIHRLNPNDLRIALKLCYCQEALGHLEKALQTAFKIHWEQPDNSFATIAIGDISHQTGNIEQAIKYWDLSLTLADITTEKILHIGAGLWAVGQRTKAHELLHKELNKFDVKQREFHCIKLKQLMQKAHHQHLSQSELNLFLDLLQE